MTIPSFNSSSLGFAFLFWVATGTVFADPDPAMIKRVDPFLSDHCYDCHDDTKTEADLDLTALDFDVDDEEATHLWQRIYERVETGEMPPSKKPAPAKEDKEAFLSHLEKPLLRADERKRNKYGRVNSRRLTRVEYEHTIHDLIGIGLPLVNLLPEDPEVGGFQTVADAQQLSLFHVEAYLQAADLVLSEAFQRLIKGDPEWRIDLNPDLATRHGSGNYRGPEKRNGQLYFWKLYTQFYGRVPPTKVPESGWYKITLKQVKGVNRGPDDAVWGYLRTGAGKTNDPLVDHVALIEATEKPRDLEFTTWMNEGDLVIIRPGESADPLGKGVAKGGNINFKASIDLAKQGTAAIVTSNISLERVLPFGKRWDLRQKLVPGIEFENGKPKISDQKAELTRLIQQFAGRAFRRPVTDQDIAPYLTLSIGLPANTPFFERLSTAYRAILCSPNFLTFVEAPGELDAHAVATRLSYALINSLPDKELTSLADKGELVTSGGLKTQINRLLNDPKGQRFIESFTDQWLDMDEIDFTSPDPRRFRSFDSILQHSMLGETRGFIQHMIKADLGVRQIIQSDFAIANTRLATHYRYPKEIKLIPGQGFQRVKLPEKTRSGLVTQGAVLKVTADGSVTSPIIRGVWVAERILGRHIPPPPPDIPAVEPDIRGAANIRDQIEKHKTDMACASCHLKIDPAGFALEGYDPIGRERSKYGTAKNAAIVDSSGVTPEGSAFDNVWQWKRIYYEQPEFMARAFTTQFLTYATGARPTFGDRPEIEAIVERAAHNDYGMRSLIHACLTSRIFLYK